MNNRLIEIIKYKTGGKQTDFATLLGWTPQYLAKLLKGENFGLTPVMTIIEKLPEINARWFLTGEGEMIDFHKYTDIRKTMLSNMISVLDVEKFMPIMTPEELHNFEQIITGGKKPDFSPAVLEKWQTLLSERGDKLNTRFKAASGKSETICRQKKTK
jgi:hypothetical protein